MFSVWLFVFVYLMAGTGSGRGRGKKATVQKRTRTREPASGSEYEANASSETESEDWETLCSPAQTSRKGKEPAAPSTGKGKEKAPVYHRRRRGTGVTIPEQTDPLPPVHPSVIPSVDPKRSSLFASRLCIGERAVSVKALVDRSPEFLPLYQNGVLDQICYFPEQSGYCLELIREFYMRAGNLDDHPGGSFSFTTMVRGVPLVISPATIGSALSTPASTDGVYFLNGDFDSLRDWRQVVNGVCPPRTKSAGNSVYSKELRPEYRFLNFIVAYNILPTMNSKIVRWERLLYMYLVGHPSLAQGLNINVPFLIWHRMTRDMKSTNIHERLPFPMIIMRILREHNVDTSCASYERSLGTINDTTVIKSGPPGKSSPEAGSSSARRARTRTSSAAAVPSTSEVTLESLDRRVDKLQKTVSKVSRMVKLLFEKLGCQHDDVTGRSSGDSE